MNIYGQPLQVCNTRPLTGFRRTGFCVYEDVDHGSHTVCAIVTPEFLSFTLQQGNDLVTPSHHFPGLKEGDLWCLCAHRWLEAYKAGVAPPVVGRSSNLAALRIIPKKVLKSYVVVD
jgi:uncharacterized protein (DUF2237 family)